MTTPFWAVIVVGANRVAVPSGHLGSHLYASARCGGVQGDECPAGRGDSSGYAAVVYLYAADILLEQSGGPIAKEVSGPLATEATVQGISDLVFSASDPGAGVWETVFSVDGRVVQTTVPNEYGGHCKNAGQTTDGLPAFLYLQPCPQSESVDVPFDTTAVRNGAHHLVVSVLDAAGNLATVLDREINVENAVPAAPASPGVAVMPAAKRRSRARLTLTVQSRRQDRHHTVFFSGRLLSRPIPRGGKRLVLEVQLRNGAWLKVGAVRTGAQGRFHTSYGFEFLGPGRWQIRALCEAEAGYRFAKGTSNVVRVRVF